MNRILRVQAKNNHSFIPSPQEALGSPIQSVFPHARGLGEVWKQRRQSLHVSDGGLDTPFQTCPEIAERSSRGPGRTAERLRAQCQEECCPGLG